MLEKLIEYLKDKKILILGFGAEGQSTYKTIRKYLKEKQLHIADKKENFNEQFEMLSEDTNVISISGEKYLDNLEEYDIIIKSPGISFKDIDTSNIEKKIKSQLELLLEFTDAYTIGITGTKGKSTTSTLIYKVLEEQGKNVLLLGNIGIPVFDYIDTITKDMYIVLEISSHQLQYVEKSPNISILLNIYEEHLDHYKSLEEYVNSKLNILKFQNEEDYSIYNIDNELINKYLKIENLKSKKYEITYENTGKKSNNANKIYHEEHYIKDEKGNILYDTNQERKLLGKHNENNIMFVLAVSEILKLDLPKTVETINKCASLPHRMELVGKYDDIIFYNDSIATIPEATINTIEALKNVNTLILGGMDRGVHLEGLIKYLNKSNIENLICMPKTGYYIGNNVTNKNINVIYVESMKEAVENAKKVTKKDTICLLSPAAASYGFYKNFKEKGEEYKRLVKN